jgi:hypothetical protein
MQKIKHLGMHLPDFASLKCTPLSRDMAIVQIGGEARKASGLRWVIPILVILDPAAHKTPHQLINKIVFRTY